MSRALRRHPSAKQSKAGGKAARVVPRTGAARPAPHHAGRSGFAAVAGWRPRFFMDIIGELRKVVWPTRQEAMHLTMVVIIVSVILGAFLGGIDIGFGWLIDNTLLR